LVTETVGMTGLSVRLIVMRERPPFVSHDPRSTQEGFTKGKVQVLSATEEGAAK
jgi:hypothetical protein